jgi:RNA polymerase sigma-70 factor (ECF subfamily)
MSEEHAANALSDAALVARAANGERDAFGFLVERYWRMAVALALAKVRDVATAEDVAQESFVSAHAEIARLRRPERFAGWLAKIVAQRSVDAIRKCARERKVFVAAQGIPPGIAWAPSCNPGLTSAQAGAVREAVGCLPEKYQSVVIMRYVAGLAAAEIAERLGERPGTVRVRLHRAVGLLARELSRIAPEVTK